MRPESVEIIMKRKKSSLLFKLIKGTVRLFYPRIEVVGIENLPDEPSIIVSNHAKMNGPIACELYFPGKRKIWCAEEMMHTREVPSYAFQDFWSEKPGYIRWYYRILSYLIAPVASFIFNHANTIAVYRDRRIVSTLKETGLALAEGTNVIIFPEHHVPHNHIVNDFQKGFVDIARLYYRRTGKEIQFVPMYLTPRLKKMVLGKPIRYNHEATKAEEQTRICEYLMDEITDIACSLPKHTVIPYPNLPKKEYPTNIPETEDLHEETCY